MQQTKATILCTRPIEPALLQKAAAEAIVVDTIEFIRTEAIISDELKKIITPLEQDALTVVFTSMNAVEALDLYLQQSPLHWRVFCIGTTTKKLVEERFGKASIIGTANSASELADLIIADKNITAVTFFCGDQRRDELPAKLSGHTIKVNEIIVYKTFEVKEKINKQYDGILFFSPSAVDSFFSTNTAPVQTILFAIGNTTANAIKKYSSNTIIIGGIAGKEELFNQMIDFFVKRKLEI